MMVDNPVIDFDTLEYRLIREDRSPVLILTAATRLQRERAAEFARAAAGDLLAEDLDPIRTQVMDGLTPLQRGFSMAVTQIETLAQAEEYGVTLRHAPRQKYRGFVLVVPPVLTKDPKGPLSPWVRGGIVVRMTNDD